MPKADGTRIRRSRSRSLGLPWCVGSPSSALFCALIGRPVLSPSAGTASESTVESPRRPSAASLRPPLDADPAVAESASLIWVHSWSVGSPLRDTASDDAVATGAPITFPIELVTASRFGQMWTRSGCRNKFATARAARSLSIAGGIRAFRRRLGRGMTGL